MKPIVTFTTDFGYSDTYVAEMKGVILSLVEDAVTLIDVTHAVPHYSVESAASIVRALYQVYPPRTVHLVIVDPGVGSSRRAIAVSAHGQFFLGPDNGVLTEVLDSADHIIEINPSFRRVGESRTFDGRDLFAPVAAKLLNGAGLPDLGMTIIDPLRLAKMGYVVESIDHFGNVRTNIPADKISDHSWITIGNSERISMKKSYSEIESGKVAGIISSNGMIEIAAREQSAAQILNCHLGEAVTVS